MNKIIFKFPVRVAVKFTRRDFANANVRVLATTDGFFAPFDADFSREFRYILVVFMVGPKFNLGTRFFR